MHTFHDFDAWSDAIRGADLRLACDTVETPVWQLGSLHLGSVVLQMASEGGGNLCYGGNTHAGPIIFLPLTRAEDHVVNCERCDDRSLLFIPPGADFCIRVQHRAHSWCSIALPPGTAAPAAMTARSGGAPGSSRVECSPAGVARLKSVVAEISANLLALQRPDAEVSRVAAADTLSTAAEGCLGTPRRDHVPVGRPKIDRARIIRRVMEILDADPRPSAARLARDVGVTDRTLLRVFQDTFGMGPTRYITLRMLHRVRRALQQETTTAATVANVLSRHGIWEFGRFAARYRRQFGESLSDTLRRRS